jgi:hypothetical protein
MGRVGARETREKEEKEECGGEREGERWSEGRKSNEKGRRRQREEERVCMNEERGRRERTGGKR